MKWSNAITFDEPLADVQLLAKTPVPEALDPALEREKAVYEQGRREGAQLASQQLAQQRGEFAELQNGILNSLKQTLPQMALEMESALIELALEAAKKISGAVKIDAKLVENVVREALAQAQDTSNISVQLHPDDLALLGKHKSPLLAGLPETGPLRFAGSPEVARGGCIVLTRFGIVDAQRETKLEQLRKAVST